MPRHIPGHAVVAVEKLLPQEFVAGHGAPLLADKPHREHVGVIQVQKDLEQDGVWEPGAARVHRVILPPSLEPSEVLVSGLDRGPTSARGPRPPAPHKPFPLLPSCRAWCPVPSCPLRPLSPPCRARFSRRPPWPVSPRAVPGTPHGRFLPPCHAEPGVPAVPPHLGASAAPAPPRHFRPALPRQPITGRVWLQARRLEHRAPCSLPGGASRERSDRSRLPLQRHAAPPRPVGSTDRAPHRPRPQHTV